MRICVAWPWLRWGGVVVWALAVLAVGCGREIGDGCRNAIDCSSRGDRNCDTSQPGGYCTINGCDPGTCPDSARCVAWQGALERTSSNWCMQACGKHSDCRGAYACRQAVELVDEAGTVIAEVIDEDAQQAKFCVAGPRD